LNGYVKKNGDSLGVFLITQYYVNSFPLGADNDLSSIRKGGPYTINKDKEGKSVSLSVNGNTYSLPSRWDERKATYDKAMTAFSK